MVFQYFKIRKVGTELYSTGGSSPNWSPKGKVWTNLGHIKSHLGLLDKPTSWSYKDPMKADYKDAEVVEFAMVPTGSPMSVGALLQKVFDLKAQKAQAYEEARKKHQEAEEVRKLLELKRKYPNV